MDKGVGIRDQIAADNRLQEEINRALKDFADSLPGAGDLRLVRILTRTLEPSWTEHVSFQDHVVFPIVEDFDGGAKNMTAVIDRLRAEHAGLAERHSEVREQLESLLDGDRSNSRTLAELLKGAVELRSRHFEAETTLAGCLPELFTQRDLALLGRWLTNRPKPPFPLSVLNHRRRRLVKD